jgi:hypothetical protein
LEHEQFERVIVDVGVEQEGEGEEAGDDLNVK